MIYCSNSVVKLYLIIAVFSGYVLILQFIITELIDDFSGFAESFQELA